MSKKQLQTTSNTSAPAAPIQRTRRKQASSGQEFLRQWILLIPLATAAAGSAAMRLAQEYAEMLPALFFVGALLITVAMLHQRHLLQENQDLAERVQEAHERLDILHRLEVGLNETLDVRQVARTVLDHALLSTGADAAALWLNPRFDTAAVRSGSVATATVDQTGAAVDGLPRLCGRNWTLAAADGWHGSHGRAALEACHRALDAITCCGNSHLIHVQGGDSDCPTLAAILDKGDSAIVAPVRWNNESIGVVMTVRHGDRFDADDAVLLDAMAMVSGPSLENSLLYQTAAERANIDGLTGLYNHRAVQERLTQEVARAQRAHDKGLDEPLSIIVMDLTDFKIFNDTYGHGVGDDVLRTVADCLRENFRTSDIVARYGGDEFLALLPSTDLAGAQAWCERLIKSLEARPFESGDLSGILIRLACGIGSFPLDGHTAADLFEAADARLYEAKHRGTALLKDDASQGNTAGIQTTMAHAAIAAVHSGSEALNHLWKSFGVLDTLITAINNRDRYTRRHSEQVMTYALLIAQEMDLSPQMREAVQTCGLLHDVGKVAVPDAILRKPGRLSPDETRLMQQHTEFGAMIVRNVPHVERVLEGVRSHHEAYDGSGYPDRLRGEDIPLMGRLLAVPVCFSAMTTDRPYRKALTIDEALNEIACARGTQFDPDVVDAFLRAMNAPQAENSMPTLALNAPQAVAVH
ncbi:MAG TPA: diguanylate cyclase [Abditibacteriaceae bacterium]|jgi:diguanylate cyclase (GGDEF)-like protein/putative nucleotidyltransferase with HDIG domain